MPAPRPVTIESIVDYHVAAGSAAERAFGSGHRLVILFNRGRKNISFLDLGSLAVKRLPITEEKYTRPAAGETRPRRIAKYLSSKARLLDKRTKTLRAIIAALREKPPA